MEGWEELGGDLSQLVKGKRTKRQRPLSPIPFPIKTHDSSTRDHLSHHNSSSSAESTTTEEEDTAKCLILLAQGHNFSSKKVGDVDQDFKFNSKKYIEPGTCVYECKTCNRTFPSFQALGGHRASHTKPKNMSTLVLSDEDQDHNHDRVSIKHKNNNNNNSQSSSLSLQMTNPTNKRSKFHECSYCGAEFTSGQALGGHMRRHRGGPVGANTTLSLSTSPSMVSFENQESDDLLKNAKNGLSLSLSLDLNLPAPEDDPNPTIAFNSKKQQKKEGALALYTPPTLVDCQY